MLLQMNLRHENESNHSESAFVSEQFYFERCQDKDQGMYILISLPFLCFAIGLPACVAILWDLFQRLRKKTRFTPNDVFMLNITIMDILSLVFIPLGLINYLTWNIWVIEETWNFFFVFNVHGRPLLMACSCLDCYVAVVHPITYREKKSLTRRVLMVVAVWVVTVATGVAYVVFYDLYLSYFPTVPFIISIVVIGICDFSILQTLKRSDPGKKSIHPQKQRAIQTIINSLVLAIISYLPPTLLIMIGRPVVTDDAIYLCTILFPFYVTSMAGSAVMPILHLNNLRKCDCFKFGFCKNS